MPTKAQLEEENWILRAKVAEQHAVIQSIGDVELRKKASQFVVAAREIARAGDVSFSKAIKLLEEKQPENYKCWVRFNRLGLRITNDGEAIQKFLELAQNRAREKRIVLGRAIQEISSEQPELHREWVNENIQNWLESRKRWVEAQSKEQGNGCGGCCSKKS